MKLVRLNGHRVRNGFSCASDWRSALGAGAPRLVVELRAAGGAPRAATEPGEDEGARDAEGLLRVAWQARGIECVVDAPLPPPPGAGAEGDEDAIELALAVAQLPFVGTEPVETLGGAVARVARAPGSHALELALEPAGVLRCTVHVLPAASAAVVPAGTALELVDEAEPADADAAGSPCSSHVDSWGRVP